MKASAPKDVFDFRNTNSLWCSLLVEVLHRMGARQAVTCPGSRSTPLTMALARHKGIEAIPVLDERSAAFFALGLARQHRRATILVCTSGTAAANFLPAVIEAHESRVPLLVLTADRPPELRECRSGQTIDQQKLYGGYVNFHHEMAVPEATLLALRYARQTAIAAWERTLLPLPGPVHLNCPFRDPLPPLEDGTSASLAKSLDVKSFLRMIPAGEAAGEMSSARGKGVVVDFPEEQGLVFPEGRTRGLIIAGPAQPASPLHYSQCVAKIVQALHWPVLADALSPLRNFARLNPGLVGTYDTLLRSPRVRRTLRPEFVLCLGGWPTSKQLREWLQALDVETFILDDDHRNLDALHVRSRHLRTSVELFAHCLGRSNAVDAEWLRAWRTADTAAQRLLGKRLKPMRTRFEGKASWLLAQHLPKGTPVFIASSMPVRDAEYFWLPGNGAHPVHFNRGANGIDGTLSTALGTAHGRKPAVLLTGDLALLHDANGFLIAPKFRGSLTIVLINNEGGGIFGHLPVAKFDPPYEEYFATPQAADFKKLCATHGVEHVMVRNWAHFTGLAGKLPAKGIRVLELRTDRKHDAALRQRMFAEVAEEIDRALE